MNSLRAIATPWNDILRGLMTAYIIRRLLFIMPTMFGIMLVAFVVVQFAPGGPVEQVIAKLTGSDTGATSRISGSPGGDFGSRGLVQGGSQVDAVTSKYRGAQGLDPEFIKKLEMQFGFDKPAPERFCIDAVELRALRFRQELFPRRQRAAADQGKAAGVDVARHLDDAADLSDLDSARHPQGDGRRLALRRWTSSVIIVGYAIPGFLFAILLIILFAGGSFFDWFPLRGLVSENWSQLPWWQKIPDYFWHLTLPIMSMALSAFATMTLLTKNSFLEEIRKQYVLTARAKGCTSNQVLYGHVFRNAMLIVIAGFPSAFVHAFFTGSLLIETIFSLDGLGLLGFESVLNRDYPVVFATLYIFSLIGVVVNLISDLTYTWIDPRIDFETREV